MTIIQLLMINDTEKKQGSAVESEAWFLFNYLGCISWQTYRQLIKSAYEWSY